MSDRTKNIITNIIGLLLVVFAALGLYLGKINFLEFSGTLVTGFGFFIFKASVTKDYIKKYLDKYLKKS